MASRKPKHTLSPIRGKLTAFLKTVKLTHLAILTLAGAINAFGITMFLNPVNLYDSGISGTSMLMDQMTPPSLSVFLLMLNIPLFLYGLKKQGPTFTLYSIVAYAVGVKVIDYVVEGFDRAKCANIVTVKPDEVCTALSDTFETGATRIEVRGGYSNQPKTMVYFVVNRFQVTKMKELVHDIDPTAFITISEVADVFSANIRK